MPPELSSSFEDRIRAKAFRPAPDPPLKMKPSSRYQFRMESIESSTDHMKQLCTRRRVGEVFARLGLDLEHVHRTEVLDRAICSA